MLVQVWKVIFFLWHSLSGTLVAGTLVKNVLEDTSPQPQPKTDSNDHHQSLSENQGVLSQPSWTPTDLTVETKTPFLLLLPFSIPLDLQRYSTKSETTPKSTEGISVTNSLSDRLSERYQSLKPAIIKSTLKNSEFTRSSTETFPYRKETSITTFTNSGTVSSLLSNNSKATPYLTTLPVHTFATTNEITPPTPKREMLGSTVYTTQNKNSSEPASSMVNTTTSKPLLSLKESSTGAGLAGIVLPTAATLAVIQDEKIKETEPKTDFDRSKNAIIPSPVEENMRWATTTISEKMMHEDVVQKLTQSSVLTTNTAETILSESDPESENQPDNSSEKENLLGSSVPTFSLFTALDPQFSDALSNEAWPSEMAVNESSTLPDCNQDMTGICNSSDGWSPAFPSSNGAANESYNPLLLLPPQLFVPLHADWNTAMGTWGIAWEAHIYGLGSLFSLVAFLSVLNLLCLPFRCPSGCSYFTMVNVFLLITGCCRAFSLFYDAYSHQDKLPDTGTLLLYEVPFPCLTSAFGIVFLLLSMRSRMQLSYSIFQHPCFLTILVILHFSATFGSILMLQIFTQLPCLFFVSQGTFVILTTLMSASFFIFYCYVRADAKHIYHLNNTSPPTERYNRCPFADSKDWDRAAVTAVFSAMFALCCAGLQLYAMLHALGFGGMEVFHPWPWWAFHLSCRICEVGMCLTLVLIVMHPIFCSNDGPQRTCWSNIFCLSHRHVTMKSPILPNNYQWSSAQQEKLVICDAIARSESECLPLYTLVENHLSSIDGLDLLYHSNRVLTAKDMDLNMKPKTNSQKSSFTSVHIDSDSTADLRPPSPINLRRSIDEALFSEALFPQSLFQNTKLYSSSNLSLNLKNTTDKRVFKENAADRGLYRTSSCLEMEAVPPLKRSVSSSNTLNATSSTEQWRGSNSSSLYKVSLDGSSLVLCSSPERMGYSSLSSNQIALSNLSQTNLNQVSQFQRRYQALECSSRESLDKPGEPDLAIQAEFINVCRQIDALSVCSDTIDL
nr:PREDICTED: proline-rich transmembrane protein 4 [Lepisosteus oculatus]